MSLNPVSDNNPKSYSQLTLNEIREINKTKFGHIPAKVSTNLEAARDAKNKENVTILHNIRNNTLKRLSRKKSLFTSFSPQRVCYIAEDENSLSPISERW